MTASYIQEEAANIVKNACLEAFEEGNVFPLNKVVERICRRLVNKQKTMPFNMAMPQIMEQLVALGFDIELED